MPIPGHVRVDLGAASQLTESWKMTNDFSNMVTWRYAVALEVAFVLFVDSPTCSKVLVSS